MSRIWILAVPALLVTAGCKKSPEPISGEGRFEDETQQWEPLEPDMEEGPIGEDRGLEGLPEAAAPMGYRDAVAQLREATEDLRTSTDIRHDSLVQALNALGDAVASLAEVEDAAKFRTDIRTYTDRIQVSDPTSLDHGDWTKSALKDAVNQLEKVAKARDLEGMDARFAAINDQLRVLDPGRPLVEQREVVAAALTQMTEVLEF
ncbi:MAG: hypothetical protein ACK4YP_14065, partial [Myxococcota bacterium]